MGLQDLSAAKEEELEPEADLEPEAAVEEAVEAQNDAALEETGAAKKVALLVAEHGVEPPLEETLKAYQACDDTEKAEFMTALQDKCGNEYALKVEEAAKGGEKPEGDEAAAAGPEQPPDAAG